MQKLQFIFLVLFLSHFFVTQCLINDYAEKSQALKRRGKVTIDITFVHGYLFMGVGRFVPFQFRTVEVSSREVLSQEVSSHWRFRPGRFRPTYMFI